MALTKLSNMVNPEVLADMIAASLPSKIKFSPVARIDRTLVGQPGNTITVPRYEYIGAAVDLAEGEASVPVLMETNTSQATVKKAVKSVEISDEAKLSGYGDPVGNAEDQLRKSVADKVDDDAVAALDTSTLQLDTFEGGTAGEQISYNVIVDGIDKFEEEDDEPKILYIHPLQKGTIRKDPEFIANVPNAYMTGAIGEIAGCEVVSSSKVPFDSATNTFTNFIVKPGALDIYLKRDVMVEFDRDKLRGTDVVVANQHYTVVLADESKAVKVLTRK
ncbi:N4-gp56 family major capsid protein [Metabacillus litoralis]|nr:N4-gp56 family major capsid protein [Metabacillus litoralis]